MVQKVFTPVPTEKPLKATPDVKAPEVEVEPKEERGFAIIEPDVETAQPEPEKRRYHALRQ